MRGRSPLLGLLLVVSCSAPIAEIYGLDHQHHAVVHLSLSGMELSHSHDGRQALRHGVIDLATLAISPSGQRVAYAAKAKGADWFQVFLLKDGRATPRPGHFVRLVPQSLQITDEGAVVFAHKRGTHLWVSAYGREFGPYESLGSLQLDPFGKTLAYLAKAQGAAVALRVTQGGSTDTWGPFPALAELALSKDPSAQVALIAKQEGRWWVLGHGHKLPSESAAGLRYSEDGKSLVYVETESGKQRVVEVTRQSIQKGPWSSRIDWRSLTPLARGGVAYVAEDQPGQLQVVTPTLLGEPYEEIRGLLARGDRVAFIGRRHGQERIDVLPGGPGAWFPEVGSLTLGEKSPVYLARVQGGSLQVVMPQRRLPLVWAVAGSLVECNGEHVALLGGRTKRDLEVLVDGKAVSTFTPEELASTLRTWGVRGVRAWLRGVLGALCKRGVQKADSDLTQG